MTLQSSWDDIDTSYGLSYLHRGIDGDSQISQNRMWYDEIEYWVTGEQCCVPYEG